VDSFSVVDDGKWSREGGREGRKRGCGGVFLSRTKNTTVVMAVMGACQDVTEPGGILLGAENLWEERREGGRKRMSERLEVKKLGLVVPTQCGLPIMQTHLHAMLHPPLFFRIVFPCLFPVRLLLRPPLLLMQLLMLPLMLLNRPATKVIGGQRRCIKNLAT